VVTNVRNASDQDVLARTQGLISYIRYLIKSDRSPVRDFASYASTVWLADLPVATTGLAASADNPVVVLEYLHPRPHPRIPDVLRGWLDEAVVADPRRPDPRLADEGPVRRSGSHGHGPDHRGVNARRSDAPEVVRAYQEWLPTHRDWAQLELAAQHHREVYEKVRGMAGRVARFDDKYEVVLAVGLLAREEPNSRHLSRHVITRRLSIQLQPDARITISLDGGAPARLEDREFLGQDDGYSADRSAGARKELDDEDLDPLDEDVWTLLQRWAELSFEHAVHCDPGRERQTPPVSSMTLTRAPAIILRERSGNALTQYYEQIATSLSAPGVSAPLGLAQLVAPLDQKERLAWAGGERRADADTGEQLLPLAANEAQHRVLERMNSDTAVVVEGPPGTGKTHTIANLVCALLAQGKRVLVTSQKEQALRELRDKLPPQIRDLCVTVTSARGDGTDDFSRSVTALTEQLGSSTQAEEKEIIRESAGRRNSLIKKAGQLRDEILRSRATEWEDHPSAPHGYGGTLAAIASRVVSLAPRLEWLARLSPDSPAPVAGPPLSTEEALELRSLLGQETGARQARRTQRFPDLEVIPTADTFHRVLSAAREADDLARQVSATARALAGLSGSMLLIIEGQIRVAAAAARRLGQPVKSTDWPGRAWETRVLRDMLAGRDLDLWQDIDAAADEVQRGQHRINTLGQRQVSVPKLRHDELTAMLRADLHGHRQGSGWLRLPMVASREQRAAQRFLGSCLVDGRPPSDTHDIDAVLAWLHATATVTTHMARWASLGFKQQNGVTTRILLSDLAILYKRLRDIAAIADAHDTIGALLADQGIRMPGTGTLAGWDALCEDVADGSALARALQDQAAPGRLAARLPRPDDTEPPELADLRSSARSEDITEYRQALTRLTVAFAEWRDQRRCDDLRDRLRHWHPQLAAELARTASDPAWEDRLRSLSEAWAWLAARAYCESMHTPARDQELQRRLDETEVHIAAETERLAAARARLHLLKRIKPAERQALETYRAAMEAVGKGKGRYSANKRRAARSAMRAAQGAVPAWVMPVGKVAETIPAVQDAFDVVIVDEASQSGLEALFLLWLAPRVIAVGDDKQCAPGWPDQDNQKYLDRLAACLPDLEDHERLALEPGGNLYELLLQRFPDPVRLIEHFRSMPEIISWSSRQFYDDRLVPFRQFSPDRLPPLQVVHIDDGRTDGRDQNIRNEAEVKHLVEKLRELLENPAYTSPPRSFSIIALQGTAQAKRIEQMVNASIEPALRTRHNIRVGNPPDFQGAESDIVLLSMVVTRAFRAKTGRQEQRRFNVAATRARDQMWLFASVPKDRLKPEDLRLSLLAYMEDPPSYLGNPPSADEVPVDVLQPSFDSLFQQRLFRAVRQRGYHVVPRFPISRHYAIDLVVSDDNGRLAIACDGPIEQATTARISHRMRWERDLRRAGWNFWRVRESEFTLAPEQTLDKLSTELSSRSISPNFSAATTTIPDPSPNSWSPITLRAEEEDMASDDETQDGAEQ
jgi:hypothetical protein